MGGAESLRLYMLLLYSTRSTLKGFGDELDATAKTRVDSLIGALEEEMKGNDAKAIAARAEALGKETGKIFEAARAASAGHEQAQAQGAQPGGDDVVDAEFEDVSGDGKPGGA